MVKHARIVESQRLNIQILIYINYNEEDDSYDNVIRFPISGASAQIEIGGIATEKKAREGMLKITVEELEKTLISMIGEDMFNQTDEEE